MSFRACQNKYRIHSLPNTVALLRKFQKTTFLLLLAADKHKHHSFTYSTSFWKDHFGGRSDSLLQNFNRRQSRSAIGYLERTVRDCVTHFLHKPLLWGTGIVLVLVLMERMALPVCYYLFSRNFSPKMYLPLVDKNTLHIIGSPKASTHINCKQEGPEDYIQSESTNAVLDPPRELSCTS